MRVMLGHDSTQSGLPESAAWTADWKRVNFIVPHKRGVDQTSRTLLTTPLNISGNSFAKRGETASTPGTSKISEPSKFKLMLMFKPHRGVGSYLQLGGGGASLPTTLILAVGPILWPPQLFMGGGGGAWPPPLPTPLPRIESIPNYQYDRIYIILALYCLHVVKKVPENLPVYH